MRFMTTAVAVVACGSMLLGGCQSKGGSKYNIQITFDKSIEPDEVVEIYMKGYTHSEYADGQYDGSEDLAKLVGEMGTKSEWSYVHPRQGRDTMLTQGDPVWNDWKESANWVVVFARIGAGTYAALPLPTDKEYWTGKDIWIQVESEGLDLKTKQAVN